MRSLDPSTVDYLYFIWGILRREVDLRINDPIILFSDIMLLVYVCCNTPLMRRGSFLCRVAIFSLITTVKLCKKFRDLCRFYSWIRTYLRYFAISTYTCTCIECSPTLSEKQQTSMNAKHENLCIIWSLMWGLGFLRIFHSIEIFQPG